MRVLVTGATGFVGGAVVSALTERGHIVRACLRGPVVCGAQEQAIIGDIGPETEWQDALAGIDAVVHLAARVHVMHETVVDPLSAFRRVNVEGTRALAEAAAKAGVKRLVFLSSIKVNGEATGPRAFDAKDPIAPKDPYGVSKAEAESALHEIAARTSMEVVIMRPPLVYGPGVRANFLRMMTWLDRGVPLPFGAVDNRRSLVFLGNLADALVSCVEHPEAANQTFLVSDSEDLSTSSLLRRLGQAMGRPARLFFMPPSLMKSTAGLIGMSAQADRLLGSLQVDSQHLRKTLGWQPPFTVDQALEQTARWFEGRAS